MFGFGPDRSFASCNFLMVPKACRIMLGASGVVCKKGNLSSSDIGRFALPSPLCGGRGGR